LQSNIDFDLLFWVLQSTLHTHEDGRATKHTPREILHYFLGGAVSKRSNKLDRRLYELKMADILVARTKKNRKRGGQRNTDNTKSRKEVRTMV
jgi:hypothetical protein